MYSKKYNNADNTLCPIITLYKKIDGTYCVGEVVPQTKKKTIWIASARIQKADIGSQVPNGNKITPQPTSKTPLASSSASTNIVSKTPPNVNSNSNNSTLSRVKDQTDVMKYGRNVQDDVARFCPSLLVSFSKYQTT